MNENDSKYDPWSNTLDEINKRFSPLEDQKTELLTNFSVNDQDIPRIDAFFQSLQALEEVGKATGTLDREKLQRNTITLFEIPQQLEAINPSLAQKLNQMREDHIQRIREENKKDENEHARSIVETLRFGLVAETALDVLEEKYPNTVPQGVLLSIEVRQKVERVIRPYYDRVNRSYQDIPDDTTEVSRFNTFFWTLDQSLMIEELHAVFAQ